MPIDLMPLGVISPNSGILAGKVHLFLAHYAAEVSNPADTHEIHGVRWLSYEELRAEIALGNVSDSFTLSALSLAILSRKLDLGS